MNKQEYNALGRNLTKEERKELFKEFDRTKDPEIREILIEEHLYIAEILSKKYVNRGIEYDDIFQIASLGLIYAIDRYDVNKGFEFSSFATPTIIGEIKKYFRDKGWTIRVPRRVQELSKKINDTKILLAQQYQRNPTVEDIAKYLDVTEEEVLETMEASKVYQPQSMDMTYESQGDDNDMNLKDILGEDEKYFDKIEMHDFLERAMVDLNEVEKTILIDRYFNRKTQVSIANKLNISQMTVSRIEKKILKKMRSEIKKSMEA